MPAGGVPGAWRRSDGHERLFTGVSSILALPAELLLDSGPMRTPQQMLALPALGSTLLGARLHLRR